jgi:hypothetical protein
MARASTAPIVDTTAPPGVAYCCCNTITQARSSSAMPPLIRTSGMARASPASTAEARTPRLSACQHAIPRRGARAVQEARASSGVPATASSRP